METRSITSGGTRGRGDKASPVPARGPDRGPWSGLADPRPFPARLGHRLLVDVAVRAPLSLLIGLVTAVSRPDRTPGSQEAPPTWRAARRQQLAVRRRRLAQSRIMLAAAMALAAAAAVLALPSLPGPGGRHRSPSGGGQQGLPAAPAWVLASAADVVGTLPFPAWGQYPGEIVTSDTMEGDAPNPFILQVGSEYYMYSSQGNVLAVNANIPLRTSRDLVHWSAPSDAMPSMPSWAETGLNWSPDVHYLDGRYVMWFSAVTRGIAHGPTGDGLMKCIGWATSDSPAGPFVPDPGSRPPLCQVSHFGSIDPHLFVAPDGSLWLVYKSDDNASIHPQKTTIWVQRLAADGTTLEGDPIALIEPTEPWQGSVVENGQMVFADGAYWLFYSSNGFSTPSYSVDVDSCAGPTGPCGKPTILLGSVAQGEGPGEAEVFIDSAHRIWLAYAPWAQSPTSYRPRPVALTRLGFTSAGPYLAAP